MKKSKLIVLLLIVFGGIAILFYLNSNKETDNSLLQGNENIQPIKIGDDEFYGKNKDSLVDLFAAYNSSLKIEIPYFLYQILSGTEKSFVQVTILIDFGYYEFIKNATYGISEIPYNKNYSKICDIIYASIIYYYNSYKLTLDMPFLKEITFIILEEIIKTNFTALNIDNVKDRVKYFNTLFKNVNARAKKKNLLKIKNNQYWFLYNNEEIHSIHRDLVNKDMEVLLETTNPTK